MKTSTKRTNKLLFALISGLVAILLSIGLVAPGGVVSAQEKHPVSPYLTEQTVVQGDGTSVTASIISGPPHPLAGFEAQTAPVVIYPAAAKTLTVPTFSWVFGCSSVSAAMIAGYYDRNGYAKMYTGPTNAGLMPLNDLSWGTWSDGYAAYPNNPLIASHNGVDGRATRGSLDNYWEYYDSPNQDPYITNGWVEHTWGSAIGDYMKTSQSKYSNNDGGTQFWNYTDSPTKLTCAAMETLDASGGRKISQVDGSYGRKLFYQSKGYTVTDCYNQATNNKVAGGFTFANYKAQIDTNKPVLINLAGHSVAGVGYDDTTVPPTVYIHDTWNSSGNQQMPWGGSYDGMEMLSVSIVNLAAAAPVTVPTLIAPAGAITDATPAYTWSKVTSATQYQFAVYKGSTTTLAYPIRTVLTGNCGTSPTNCSNTPTTALALGPYTWKARAYVGGAWKAWSAAKAFTLSAPTMGFNSQFNGGAAGWVKRPGGTWNLTGGTTYWTTGAANFVSSTSYNKNFTNFTYQARMKRVSSSGYTTGLVVRGTPTFGADNQWNNAYNFLYTQDGYFSVFKGVGGSWSALKGYTASGAIVKNGWNTLKVVASGTSFKFYINNTLVWSGASAGLPSGQVGLWMYRAATAERMDVDWATLTATTSSPAGETVEAGQVELPIDPANRQSPYYAPMP